MHQISIDPQNVTERLLKSAKFLKINPKEEGFSPTPAFFKVLSNSLPAVQGHSFRNALEMLILFKLCLPILVQ